MESEQFRTKHDRFNPETIMNARCPNVKALLQYSRRKEAQKVEGSHKGVVQK